MGDKKELNNYVIKTTKSNDWDKKNGVIKMQGLSKADARRLADTWNKQEYQASGTWYQWWWEIDERAPEDVGD